MALFVCGFVLLLSAEAVLCSHPTADIHALLAFKQTIWHDPTAALSDWNPNRSHPCNWTGVSCTPTTHTVSRLSLPFLNLSAHLGAELGSLTSLQYLNLSGNAFTAGIPPELGRLKHLMFLDLSFNQLQSHIPSELGELQNLQELSLAQNNLTGKIPSELGKLENLQFLYLQGNNFTGEIPSELSELQNLQDLQLGQNNLTGKIPSELGKLENLQFLNLQGNNLTGEIPLELGELQNLQKLSLAQNNLTGKIPSELSKLENLQLLYLWENNLTGEIPLELGELQNLQYLELGENNLTGNIPSELGKLENLQILSLWRNNLRGEIPSELGELQNLQMLSLPHNNLTGKIPLELSKLENLQLLYLWGNNLTGEIPWELGELQNLQEFDLQANKLTGKIPRQLSNLTRLYYLSLDDNKLSGNIPKELCQLKLLKYLFLDNNKLSGEIPYEIKSLENLSMMSLANNKLTGNVPSSFGDLSNLVLLNLGHNCLNGSLNHSWSWRQRDRLRVLLLNNNQLEGSLPAWIWTLNKLQALDVSINFFTGNISTRIAQLDALKESGPIQSNLSYPFAGQDLSLYLVLRFKGNEQSFPRLYEKEGFLDLSSNCFGGIIPRQLGLLQGLRSLNLSNNRFVGHIPQSLGNISNLESLDLSNNSLDGRIPGELLNIHSLAKFNLSYNNLSGSIPTGRQFNTFDNSSYIGNIRLCGLPLSQSCSRPNHTHDAADRTSSEKGFSPKAKLIVIILPVALLLLFCLMVWFRTMFVVNPNTENEMCWFEEGLKVNANALYNCTDGYSNESIIGTGSSSTVYRGALENGQLVAIKKFKVEGQNKEMESCFVTECRTLGQVRHRNLVKILGAISDCDTKIIVLQFMSNGSLDMHLHSSEICLLTWEARLKIAQGTAQALVYLHEQSGRGPIIHCDLKPSNILLDEDFEAHVNDFGIARLLDAEATGITLSSTFKGSIGYLAPEFAYGAKVSPKADVYGYGVVLLEMVTRKTPTSSTFVGQNSLVEWVRSLFAERAEEAIEDGLKANATDAAYEQIWSVIGLALLCTLPAPSDRPSMREVLMILESIIGYRCQPFTNIDSEHMRRIINQKNVYCGRRTETACSSSTSCSY